MCLYCGPEADWKANRQTIIDLAERVAAGYSLTPHRIKPHTEEWNQVMRLAQQLIRKLVEDVL